MAKGQKTGGRTKNTPNKVTADTRQKFQKLLDNNIEQLDQDLKELEPKDRINAVLQLAKFCVPTLKAVEQSFNTTNETPKINIIYPNDENNEIDDDSINIMFTDGSRHLID